MEFTPLIALIVFVVTIGLIIWGKLDSTVVGLAGVALMVLLGVMSESQAFYFVDWNVIAILFGIWIIAIYFGKTGIPQYLAVIALRVSGNNIAIFLALIGFIAGFLSMFVDNVVIILMMAPVVFHITRQMKLPSFPFIIIVGLSANFMGTALLLGDLPPQMLHSVSGIEFSQFIWQMGRPSSFILLMITFILTLFFMYHFKLKKLFSASNIDTAVINKIARSDAGDYIKNKKFTVVSVGLFLATILAMAFRQELGLLLGFIALGGMITLVLINEIFRKQLKGPSFEEVIGELDWRALMFYIVLFILVGGINHVGLINAIAGVLAPYFQYNPIVGATLLYWVTAPIVSVVEHDAYILVFLYLIRDIAATTGITPWPLWWALLWAGTLGSNLTIAGAPALFVAQSVCQKEDSCKINIKEFLSYSAPFVIFSLVIQYVLLMLFWVIPFAA